MKFAYAMFAITLLLQPIGQILERKGMSQVGAIDWAHLFSSRTIFSVLSNPYVWGGILCSAVGLVLWLVVLSRFNVSYIYPLGAISYIVVAVLSILFLGERIHLLNWTGIALIVGGVFLLNVR